MSSEFEFLDHIRKKFSLGKTGDDCAVLPKDAETDLLVTSDMLVEGIDFLRKWAPADAIGHKALAVSLSDIAAMGGTPKWAMLSLGVPEDVWNSDFLERFYEGWHKLADEFDVELVGGDISRTHGKLVIDSTVIGEVEKGSAVLRSTAKPGDHIFMTREIGLAARGLAVLMSEEEFPESESRKAIERQLRPMPEVKAGKLLREKKLATAMIDISDGVSSDLAHICRASGVGASIYGESLPGLPPVRFGHGVPDPFESILRAGEDFVLLFTVDQNRSSDIELRDFHRIGMITQNVGNIELIVQGRSRVIEPRGYRHF